MSATPKKGQGILIAIAHPKSPTGSPASPDEGGAGANPDLQNAAAAAFMKALQTGDPAQVWQAYEGMNSLCKGY